MILRRLAVLVLCSIPLLARGQGVVDDQGIVFDPEEPPRRIISLAPDVTEILFALGLDEEIVGVTRYCDHPAAAREKRKIGGIVDPSLELIHSLSPDLIIAFRGNPLRTIARLRGLRLPVFVLDIGKDLDSLFPMIAKIGRITGREEEAARLSSDLRSRMDAVRQALRGVVREPRVFLAVHGTGLWTCGRDSYLDALIASCRAVNVAREVPESWFHYSLERLVRDNPDIILVMAASRKEFEAARAGLLKDARLRDIGAIRNDAIRFLDENSAARFGPRLADALEEAARSIHPEIFGGGS